MQGYRSDLTPVAQVNQVRSEKLEARSSCVAVAVEDRTTGSGSHRRSFEVPFEQEKQIMEELKQTAARSGKSIIECIRDRLS